jgi:hypothetical protein
MVLTDNKIEKFISKVNLGVEWFLDAGLLLVEMLDENPGIKQDIIQFRKGWITMDVLDTFEAIGRKQLAVEAMFLPRHVLCKLAELPIGQQITVATRMLPVVTGHQNGRIRWNEKPANKLTVQEAGRVIGPDGVRPIEEQAKILKLKSHVEKSIGRYTIFIMNNKPFIKHSTAKGLCTKVLVTDERAIEIDLVKILPSDEE